MNAIRTCVFVFALLVLAGCAARPYETIPVIPAETAAGLESRTLADPELRVFIERSADHALVGWPLSTWDLNTLTLAALYFNPQIEIARDQAQLANAAIITASARPNPTLSITPGIPSPYLLGMDLDFPIETHGKRAIRTAQARNVSESARIGIAVAAWKVRGQVRQALADFVTARERASLLAAQNNLLTTQVQLLQRRLSAGEISRSEVDPVRAALLNNELTTRQAETQLATARASLAEAIGVPLAALDGLSFSWPEFRTPPPPELFSPSEIQRQAVVDRLDVRAALLQYAAAEEALRLEIARQYPDFSLGPGYQLEEGNNFFTVGFSTVLPVFNRNQGPIAEAEAARRKAAADFLAVQAQGIAQAETALAQYRSSIAEFGQARDTLTTLQNQRADIERRSVSAGESDRLTLSGILVDGSSTALYELDALSRAQAAFGALEDAVQQPLEGDFVMPSVESNPSVKPAGGENQ